MAQTTLQQQADFLQREIDVLKLKQILSADEIRDLDIKEKALERINQLLLKSNEYNKQRLADLELEEQFLKRNADYLDSKQENLAAFARFQEIQIEKKDLELRQIKTELEDEIKLKGLQDDSVQKKIEEYLVEEKKLLNLKEQLEISKKLGEQTKEIISATLGISARWKETYFGKLLDKDGDSLKNMKAIGAAIKDTFTLQNVMGSTLMKIQEATVQAFIAYDMAASSLAKVAGANEQLQGVLANTARGATAYGISFQEAGRSIEALYTTLNTFSNLNQGVQEQLTISVAKLDKLGISGQESAKQIGTLSQIMGMSEVQAAKTSEELAGFALAIGKSPQQVAQDFAGASNQLAAYGNNMVNVFKDLEAQSKATGVAVNDLISIAEKFQTFEGAAQAAGKLNAALGGGFVNAMELLEASAENPAAAIDLLRTRLDEAGLAFDQMSFYEKKMIADAAGFKSIEEASRVLSMTNAEREKAAKADAERANSQKLLNEAIQRSIPLQEKLTMIFVNFGIVMRPVVEIVSGFLSAIAWLIDNVPGLNLILGTLVGIFGTMIIVGQIVTLFKSSAAALGLFNTAAAATAPAAAPAAAGIETFGAASGAAAPGIAAGGAALIEFGVALALIVLPVALLVAAMALLVNAFATMFDVILGKGDGVANTLVTLGAAMFAIGIAFNNPIILLGMYNFSAALMGIVLAMTLLPEKKVISFATISENLVKLGSIEGTNKTMEQASALVKTINEFKLDDKVSANLEKILKAAVPQQSQTQLSPTYSPTIVVKIGDKELKNVAVEVFEKNNPATKATGTT
jgi:hypothetical protein